MIIKRDYYLNRLIEAKGNRLIKVVTGLRRCGKSFLLFELFHNHLNNSGVDNSHIIEIALDDRKNIALRNPDNILKYIMSKMLDSGLFYVLLDEVQMIEDFEGVLNSLLHMKNADIYVTGSNSKFLSKDVITEFRGRGYDIHLYPLSFSEYYSAVGGDQSEAWRNYYTFGGLPQLIDIKDFHQKNEYLKQLAYTVFFSDIADRNKVKNRAELEELMQILASSIGSPCNPTKLSNTFKTLKNITISNKTITNYLNYLCDAFLVEKAIRYNIKGKKYINTLAKYYFSDLGLRNALLDFRQIEETHLMENAIYNELCIRGYAVDVGCVETVEAAKNGKMTRKQFEVDFVANKASGRYYIQSALAIPDEAKMQQETASFRRIDDAFKKILIVGRNIMPYHNNDGYLIVGVYDFMLKPELMEL